MAIGLYGPEYLQFSDGGPARKVAIYVFLPGTKTKAQLYADKSGQYTGPNPAYTDDRGELVFFAELGSYELYHAESGTTFNVEITGTDVVDLNEFVHVQSAANTIWIIDHMLGSRPSVIVEESINIADDITYPAIRHVSVNRVELRWSYAASGRATLRR
jgi:hypothetical protein